MAVDNRTFFHTVAYRGSVLTATTNTAIAGVADSILTKSAGGAFVSPPNAKIRLGIAGGINATRSRINTPEARKVGFPYIAPLNQTVVVPSPPNVADFGPAGIQPAMDDEISVEATHSDAGTQVQFAGLWLMFNRKEPDPRDRYRIRWTAAITAVVGSWASGAVTLDQTLPAGTYQIVGMDAFGTNLQLARLIFPGGGWRPGVLGRNAVASVPHRIFSDGSLGVFGEFRSFLPPQLEVYAEGANSAQEGYWDLVRVGD